MRTTFVFAYFRQVITVLGSLTLQDKHNVHTLSENINFICTRTEMLDSAHYIFSDNARVFSVYFPSNFNSRHVFYLNINSISALLTITTNDNKR